MNSRSQVSSPDGSIRLSRYVTIKKYREMERSQDRQGLAAFIYERLSERYIKPVTYGKKNGFAIMACASLLIETLECFCRGWKSSNGAGPGEELFHEYFNRTASFEDLRAFAAGFYYDVRCGILHQGETKNGWKITRSKGMPYFDPKTKTIQATKFINRLDASLRDYCHTLETSRWQEDVWKCYRRKMNAIIQNCVERD